MVSLRIAWASNPVSEIQVLGRQGQVDLFEFGAIMVYIVTGQPGLCSEILSPKKSKFSFFI